MKKEKQNLLVRDVGNYNTDICHLHETKIKGLYNNILIREQKLIALETDSKYYGINIVFNIKCDKKIRRPWTNNALNNGIKRAINKIS